MSQPKMGVYSSRRTVPNIHEVDAFLISIKFWIDFNLFVCLSMYFRA